MGDAGTMDAVNAITLWHIIAMVGAPVALVLLVLAIASYIES